MLGQEKKERKRDMFLGENKMKKKGSKQI